MTRSPKLGAVVEAVIARLREDGHEPNVVADALMTVALREMADDLGREAAIERVLDLVTNMRKEGELGS